jgi:hypothetical protein
MKNEGKSFSELLSSWVKKYKSILSFILAFLFIIIIAGYVIDIINFGLTVDRLMPLIATIFIIIILIVLYEINIFGKRMIFEEKELIVAGKLFGKEIFCKRYQYDIIEKFIIGRYYNKLDPDRNIYSLYIDNNEQIIKIFSLKTYKECLEIIDEIKRKTGKKVYDDTDTYYMLEEDLFRNYYKLKKTLDEIKNE